MSGLTAARPAGMLKSEGNGGVKMDIDKYRLFCDVAETGNFTRSAERLGYSQSGVSHILRGMERELGFSLFVRAQRGVALTANGKLLLPLVRHVVAETEKLDQTVNALRGLEAGRLSIATYSSISVHCLPPLLHRFQREHPRVDIVLKEGGADDILQWVQGSVVDVGFLSLPRPCGLDWIPLGSDPLMAVLPRDYPVEGRRAFPMAEFEEKPFIISAVGTDYDVHRALETSGVHPDLKYSSMDDRAIIAMVTHHLGVSILSRLILRGYIDPDSADGVTALPLEPYFDRELGIATRSAAELSPAARKFVEFARENLVLDGM